MVASIGITPPAVRSWSKAGPERPGGAIATRWKRDTLACNLQFLAGQFEQSAGRRIFGSGSRGETFLEGVKGGRSAAGQGIHIRVEEPIEVAADGPILAMWPPHKKGRKVINGGVGFKDIEEGGVYRLQPARVVEAIREEGWPIDGQVVGSL
ncbi:hypothetical protein O181_011869 [Austropuccinia psidii MF-1]|uniref:Uncharacterized protein n=1 Tax=Austropuccinia psidii MF-1 TaxID=1389203 RepID=A0A9Q3BTK6_9BASI|nr:hypothetical protein [Austropuccinia psidii MF-1]